MIVIVSEGLFIVFEGIDGAGTTTQCNRLVSDLEERGCFVVHTREPGGTSLGERIRSLVLDPSFGEVDPVAELLLCAASRRQHLQELIEPALRSGKPVICDRYAASSVAYQGAGRGLGRSAVAAANELATAGRTADLTIVLDVPVAEAEGRRNSRGHKEDRLEQAGMAFQERAGQAYRDMASADPEHFALIPAAGPEDEVFASVYDSLLTRWPNFPSRL